MSWSKTASLWMIALGMMWTLIFCVGTGAWLWFGELVVFHVLVVLGLLATGLTFRRANMSSDPRSKGAGK